VVIYDESTGTYETGSPVWSLFKAIYELAFKKMLKHNPMLLVGGIQAWKKHFGDVEVVRSVPTVAPVDVEHSSVPRPTSPVYTRTSSSAGFAMTTSGSDSPALDEDLPRSSLDLVAGPSRYYLKWIPSLAC
jgi:ubiquitin carboxyl-terminal hydrolase 8